MNNERESVTAGEERSLGVVFTEPMSKEEAEAKIQEKLTEIAVTHNVRILFAVEGGSRAWGFANEDSDYDVHFIYVRTPEVYISVEKTSDVLDKNNGLEEICDELMSFSGWDLLKAMTLFRASNPSLLEWLKSPTVYREDEDFVFSIRRIAEDNISLKKLGYNYHSITKNNYEKKIKGRQEVRQKDYLYILRTLFMALWIDQMGSQPPIVLPEIIDQIQTEFWVIAEFEQMMQDKAELDLEGKVQPNFALNAYIEEELTRLIEVMKHKEGEELMSPYLLDPIVHRMVGLHG